MKDKRTCEDRLEEALSYGRGIRDMLERVAVTLEKMHAHNEESVVRAQRMQERNEQERDEG